MVSARIAILTFTALVVALLGLLFAACSCECPGPPSVAPVQELAQQSPEGDDVVQSEIQTQAAMQVDQPATMDDVFNIDDPIDAGVRLNGLHEILADGNPVHNRIGWAKAGVAAQRIELICSDLELAVELDPSCDKLLSAIGSPFAQSTQILSEALDELRDVVSRRDFLSHPGSSRWDSDIKGYEIPYPLLQASLTIGDRIDGAGYIVGAHSWSNDRDAFSEALLAAVSQDDAAGLITSIAFADLWEEIQAWKPRSIRLSAAEIELGRQRIVSELDRLGVATDD